MSLAAPSAVEPKREIATISAVGTAHFVSHVLQLALAPLFIGMRSDLNVSFTDLGLLLSVFYLFSGTGQVMAGVLVDRFGADRLLISGMVLQSAAMAGLGLAPSYVAMLPLAALAGLGNSVYHPADLSILSHRVRPERLGRAFAAHVIAGNLGFAVSPIASAFLALMFGWRTALMILGLTCLTIACGLLLARPLLKTQTHAARAAAHPDGLPTISFAHVLMTPVVLLAFLYFTFSAMALVGVQSFSITALQEGYGLSASLAALALGCYQLATIVGVSIGGVLADRATHHHRVAMAGLALATLTCASIGLAVHPAWLTVVLISGIGLFIGVTMPSRDVLVRRAAPVGATGKVFGVVYSGFDIGSLLGPMVYGVLLDHHMNQAVFLAASIPLAFCILAVLGVGGRQKRG